MECVPRHNDYMVLGKQKGWRGNSQEYGRTWGLDRVSKSLAFLSSKEEASDQYDNNNLQATTEVQYYYCLEFSIQ
ncbi:hypothetical protein QYF36_020456 [Acer negundo]|nr:hypothetical protein QYF36_020456 [Acer negundo]